MNCHRCGKEVDQPVIGRRDACPRCGSDLRCCLHCTFYDPSYADGCREPQAERILDKERSNFCDYFSVRKVSEARNQQQRGKEAKDELEALFKK